MHTLRTRRRPALNKHKWTEQSAHCHLVNTFGKRFFAAYVHIQRCRQLSVLTIESNKRARKRILPRKSYGPLEDDTTPSPRRERLKLVNEKVPPEDMLLINIDDDDDEIIELNKVPAVEGDKSKQKKHAYANGSAVNTSKTSSEEAFGTELGIEASISAQVENGQESNSKNKETAISKRKVVVTTAIDVDDEMFTKANSDDESQTKVNDDHLSKMEKDNVSNVSTNLSTNVSTNDINLTKISRDGGTTTPMPTKAHQKHFESPQQKQLQPKQKRCGVRVRRENILELQQMPPKQTISEDTNRISSAMSNGTLIDTPLDQSPNSKPAAHCHLVKTFGKRFFAAYVHIQRSRQLSVLTIESNKRARKRISPRKSYGPLKDDTTSSPRRERLKLANEKVSKEGMLHMDITDEDEDDGV